MQRIAATCIPEKQMKVFSCILKMLCLVGPHASLQPAKRNICCSRLQEKVLKRIAALQAASDLLSASQQSLEFLALLVELRSSIGLLAHVSVKNRCCQSGAIAELPLCEEVVVLLDPILELRGKGLDACPGREHPHGRAVKSLLGPFGF